MLKQNNIRNFCIIAHIDHGKSTLADRMLELTQTVASDKINPQMLDTMDLERERGITIKLQPVTMVYRPENSKFEYRNSKQIQNSNEPNSKQVSDLVLRASNLSNSAYTLNLIDTPGHVDFYYEVSRSLAAVEGAVLVVDATKGIQAQTLANLNHAINNNLIIIPVINKIDLSNANINEVEKELCSLLKIEKSKIIKASAKTGEGVEEILKRIVSDIPAPTGDSDKPFKALIFDSVYDQFRGAVAYVKVVDGQLKKDESIRFLSTNKVNEVTEVGEFKLKYVAKDILRAGDIGYIITGEKNIAEIKVGDTIASCSPTEVSPISGFKIPKSVVFAGIFSSSSDPVILRKALEKLSLNDSSLIFTPENSIAFGHGFRCGFLGLLHLEIVKERLEREYNLDLIITQPSVEYKTTQIGNKIEYNEPWVSLEIVTPDAYVGQIMELLSQKRAIYNNTHYLGESSLSNVILEYEAPLQEIIVNFHDQLKSISSGYASQNYELIEWRWGDLVKLDVIISGDTISEFSRIVPRLQAQVVAQNLALKLKNIIPRQMFEVAIQVACGGKILARENISAMKKDVTAKLYGGDRTRKDKLLKKQAAGKRKLKQIGKVQIPSNVFIEILKT